MGVAGAATRQAAPVGVYTEAGTPSAGAEMGESSAPGRWTAGFAVPGGASSSSRRQLCSSPLEAQLWKGASETSPLAASAGRASTAYTCTDAEAEGG